MLVLRDHIPDPTVLLEMDAGTLGGYVLQALVRSLSPNYTGESNLWHRGSFCRKVAEEYRDSSQPSINPAISVACAAAWCWLESNGFICPKPDENTTGWYVATRLGSEISSASALKAFIDNRELPAHFLHPSLLRDVRPMYLQSRFDAAVFEAFHLLEIAIRDAARLGNDLIGIKLVSRAFDPEKGPLREPSDEAGERQALMNLMSGAIGSYKNPQSHRHVGLDGKEAREMIFIASHLLGVVDSRRTPL